MDSDTRSKSGKGLVWGVFFMLLGVAFLIQELGLGGGVAIARDLWPLVLFVIGVDNLVEKRPGGATMFFLLGTWFLACNFDLWGLTISNSWPIALIAVGAGIVGGSLSGEDVRRRQRKQEVQNG